MKERLKGRSEEHFLQEQLFCFDQDMHCETRDFVLRLIFDAGGALSASLSAVLQPKAGQAAVPIGSDSVNTHHTS